MKFIHISDIHLTENGREIWGVNTLDHFCKAIERIKDLDGIEGIFVSGDLSDDGSRWTYEFIDKAFSKIGRRPPKKQCKFTEDLLIFKMRISQYNILSLVIVLYFFS